MAVTFTIAKNPQPGSELPYLLRVPVDGGPLVLKARETWPRTSSVFCHRGATWPVDPEVVFDLEHWARPAPRPSVSSSGAIPRRHDHAEELPQTKEEATMNDDLHERRSWVIPSREGSFEGLELGYLDPDDPDERRILILAEHPEMAGAIQRGEDEVRIAGEPVNPELHITMHEIVATQLWDNEPPEMWETAERLRELDYERHEILHMLAGTVADQTFRMLRDQRPYDREEHLAALEALPDSWEAQRSD